MNIQSIGSSPSFGATPVMSCFVKNKNTNDDMIAEVYKMDTRDIEDYYEMKDLSNNFRFNQIASDFVQASDRGEAGKTFYVAKTLADGEVVSAAETSVHFITGDKKEERNGTNTIIHELAVNKKDYVNPALPVVAQVVKTAQDNHSNNVMTSFRTYDADLKAERFSATKHDTWILPKKRFNTLMSIAAKKAYANFQEQ